jgi:hypothetical protein
MSRILRVLLGLKGPVYKPIRHLPPCAVLEALSLISEEHHNISPGSVSALWESWYKITYVHGSDISAFIKRVRSDAEQINTDGMSLPRERPGPDNTDQLQKMVDGIRSAGGSGFDSEIQFALALLDAASVSRADIVSFAKKCKITGPYKPPNAPLPPPVTSLSWPPCIHWIVQSLRLSVTFAAVVAT